MGRVRGRGKKQTAAALIEDAASGEEEKIPTQRRRGRPQKPAKDRVVVPVDEAYGDEAVAVEDAPKAAKTEVAAVAGTIRKRKGFGKDGNVIGNANGNGIFAIDGGQAEEEDKEELENGIKQPKSETKDVARFAGFRTNGNRRKNKPRRAAEAGVECK